MQYLADHKNIRKIYLCLDNDIAGNAACENLAEKIPNDKVVMRLRPVKKDWNECLTAGIICFGFSIISKIEVALRVRLVEALLIHGEPLVLQDSSIFKEKKRHL